ncbi:hypothetical protein [Bacillus sp. OK048]|uniref:hypothetical protein n=1 Tax=Bacillus sp. OK048 TaxID=1882761 RepID=UPI00088ED102|nr:hypothetical protein [Bacillus sp. OK048]SDM41765.1 hypothetical protein SAMN05443253_103241 [Bacillus sp. OK048]
MSIFDDFRNEFEKKREEGRRYGRLWYRLNTFKKIVTSGHKDKYSDEDLMFILDVDEVGYQELNKKLEEILNDPKKLELFEKEELEL